MSESLLESEEFYQAKDAKASKGAVWSIAIWLIVLFTSAIVLPFFYFSWTMAMIGIALVPPTRWGITIGYHRLLTHGGFKTHSWVAWILYILGMSSSEGDPLKWSAAHRLHHAHSDHDENDPHSPNFGYEDKPILGFFHAELVWIASKWSRFKTENLLNKFVPLERKDWFLDFCSRNYNYIIVSFLVAPFLVGYTIGGFWWGMCAFTWLSPVRMALALFCTGLVNSWTHMFGYRNYETKGVDKSTNSLVVALLTDGEGNHNNHHFSPVAANHGHFSGEWDLSFVILVFLASCGLVWDIKTMSKDGQVVLFPRRPKEILQPRTTEEPEREGALL